MIALLVVLMYSVVAGAVGKRCQLMFQQRCSHHPRHRVCSEGHTAGGVLLGLFWPAALPVLLGIMLGGKSDRQTQLEASKQKELEAAKSDALIAYQRRREAEELALHLRALGKDC
jgi:hypothetical protein